MNGTFGFRNAVSYDGKRCCGWRMNKRPTILLSRGFEATAKAEANLAIKTEVNFKNLVRNFQRALREARVQIF
jgi:hypothetical protein